MNRHVWTLEQIEWLNINYGKLTPSQCAKALSVEKSKIIQKAHRLGLKLPEKLRKQLQSVAAEDCNVNPETFSLAQTKELCYLLGLMWADGFLNKAKSGYSHQVGFTMVNEDLDTIRQSIDVTGKWSYYERKQPISSWKNSTNVLTNNKRIYDFLIGNDYDKKSTVSADKILNYIPEDLKSYWFRGLIDGDGCFYYYKPEEGSTLRQFALASTYEQDWSYMEQLCELLEIKFKIKRVKNKNSTSSILRITNKPGIKKLGEFIYDGFPQDNLGLNRKYEKYLQCTND